MELELKKALADMEPGFCALVFQTTTYWLDTLKRDWEKSERPEV